MAEILATNPSPVEATYRSTSESPADERDAEIGRVSWQNALKRSIRSGIELCQRLDINPSLFCSSAEQDFPVFAPLEYVRRMQLGDSNDPLFRQVMATQEETIGASGLADAVGDLAAQKTPGLLQKYDRRVLMIATGACAVHCRYCFRRHYPYGSAPVSKKGWLNSLSWISQDDSIDEIILSGGDPLTLADESLSWLISEIVKIRHIRRIRIHTRVPVVIPQRICVSMLEWVSNCKLPLFFVLHFNHATELDSPTRKSLELLRKSGASLLNQAVLLQGVNDSFEAQRDLCLALVDQQVLPYYLHQLDLVQGALHFEVSDDKARQILAGLQSHLPGYAVPKLVREQPGRRSKTPLGFA